MASYDITSEYGSEDDVISTNPYWVLAVVRYAYPLTFNRSKLLEAKDKNIDSVSFDSDNSILSKTKPILIIDDDCVNMTISASKGSHCNTLQAVLVHSGTNYLSEILPGDWLMAWIVNSEDKKNEIVEKIKTGKSANEFLDGFKFMGRVQDIRKTLSQSPQGLRTVQYNLSGAGFSEFDSQLYYNPHLSMREVSIGQYLARLHVQISEVFAHAANEAQRGKGGIDSNLAIPTLMKVLIGEGIPNDFAIRGGLQLGDGLVSTEEAPYAYHVPEEIGRILGVTVKTKKTGAYSYADVIDLVQGLQKYSSNQFPALFHPDGTLSEEKSEANRFYTNYDLKGNFLPMPNEFNGKTVWSILNEYLNPGVNEMYTAIKLSPSGRVMPTLVVRQLPFNSPQVTQSLGTNVTGFHELPRWRASDICVRSMDIGRADAVRFNYVHITGQSASSAGLSQTAQTVMNPPIRDEQDSKRNGLRLHMQTVACSVQDTLNGPREWMAIITDFLMGQHLTLNGCFSLTGVTAPICPGDNFEFDDTLYHIESVTHSCSISGDGFKYFHTQIQVSHGVRAEAPTVGVSKVIPDTQQNPDLYLYSGVDPLDATNYDPGVTDEGEDV